MNVGIKRIRSFYTCVERNKIFMNINLCRIMEPFNNTLTSYRSQVLQLCSVNKRDITNNSSLINGHITWNFFILFIIFTGSMLVKVGLLHRKILYTLKGLNIFLDKILGFNSSNGPCENFLKISIKSRQIMDL